MSNVATVAGQAVSPASKAPHPEANRRVDVHRAVLLGLLAAGASLRLFQYLANRSLWLDESSIVASVLNRSFGGLLQPLDYGQTAPVGFLFLVKLATTVFGNSEYALRLVPLLAGLAALLASVPVARRYVSRNAVPTAVALFALAPFLIYYASEVKQYSLDVLVSVAVLALAHEVATAQRIETRRAILLMGVGGIGVWFSQPSVFMLAGTGLVLGVQALVAGDWQKVRTLIAVAVVWAVSFGGSYAASRTGLADPAYMQAFWQSGFMPLAPSTIAEWGWLPISIAHVFREPLGAMGQDASGMELPQTIAGVVAFAAGTIWLARTRDWKLALLIAPLVMVVIASALRLYPLGATWETSGRVLIFLIPSFVFLMAEGAEQLRRQLGRRAGPVVFVVLLALMLIPSATYAVVMVPQARAEIKPLLGYANAHRTPSDVLYVYYNGRSSFEYYAPEYGWDRSNTVFGTCSRLRPRDYLEDVRQLRGRSRVWFLFVDGFGAQGFDERGLLVSYLDHVGKRLDDRVSHGVYLYLYDLSTEQPRTDPFIATVPEFPKTLVAMDCRGPWAPEPYAAARG